MTEITLDEIQNKRTNQITDEEFEAAIEALRQENPDVTIQVREKQANARASVWLSGVNDTVDLPSIGLAGIINRTRNEQLRARIASGEIGADLEHVCVADEGSGNKAILRISNDAAGKAFRDGFDPSLRLDRLRKPSQKNAIEFSVELHDAEQMAAYVDQQLAHLRDERQRLEDDVRRRVREGMGADLHNVSVSMGREAIAVEFQPVEKALDEVRAIDAAKFRKGDKKNDVLDHPHWLVPVDQVEALENALPNIDAAVQKAKAEHEQAREAGREIAQRIQGQHGPVTVELNDDETEIRVSFPRDEEANRDLMAACSPRFDRDTKAWRVDLAKADALEDVLPELRETLEANVAAEQEAAQARAQAEADRKAEEAEFKRQKDVVLANIEQPSNADRGFMFSMAREVAKGELAKASEVHPYRDLVATYPDYVEAEGLPRDLRNNNARRAYQNGQRAREAREFVAERYAELTAEPDPDAADTPAGPGGP